VKKILTSILVLPLLAAFGTPSARADVTRAQCAESYERAQYLRRETKLAAAREALLVCSQDACPAVVKNDCLPWLAEVERATPTIVVAVRDETGKDFVGAKFSIDGGPMTVADGRPVSLDPGPHKLRAETSDGKFAEEQVLARLGEKNRSCTLILAKGVAPPHPIEKPITETPVEAAPDPSRTLPLVLAGVGVVALGTSVVFGVQAKSEADDVRSRCAPHCADSDLDGTRTKLLLSDIGLGIGVIALAAATYVWLTAPSSSKASTPASTVTAGGRPGSLTIRF
jgi:hypothetical protein